MQCHTNRQEKGCPSLIHSKIAAISSIWQPEGPLRKTGRGITVHEGTGVAGVGAALIGELLPHVFGHLRAPLITVGAEDCPVPSSPQLEEQMMPSAARIFRSALSLLTDY